MFKPFQIIRPCEQHARINGLVKHKSYMRKDADPNAGRHVTNIQLEACD
jgi:hypothetical protein